MAEKHIDVIASTISGSIKDWSKIDRIKPLFEKYGREDVSVHKVDSHEAARQLCAELLQHGGRTIISAGGSGTFNSVLEGCFDSGVKLQEIKLGFLRKGSADLIGKVLGMPDEIDEAVKVFADSLQNDCTVPCDVIEAASDLDGTPARRFVGYGGAELFGRIPFYTENRFMKYYKGILSQLFGDLGPFFVGASLAGLERTVKKACGTSRQWSISVDGNEAIKGSYQAMIIVNGDLGPDLPFARSAPLGSGFFHLFAIRDLGSLKLLSQFRRAWNASILNDPEKWGFETYRVNEWLEIKSENKKPFPVNIDGSTLLCRSRVSFRIIDSIRLISKM